MYQIKFKFFEKLQYNIINDQLEIRYTLLSNI